jgi:hypothetical protein
MSTLRDYRCFGVRSAIGVLDWVGLVVATLTQIDRLLGILAWIVEIVLGLVLFAFAEGCFGIESGFEDFGFVGEFYCFWGGGAEDAGDVALDLLEGAVGVFVLVEF